MNRRSLLCISIGILSVSFAGCGDSGQTGSDEDSNANPISDLDSNGESNPRSDSGYSDENDDEVRDSELSGHLEIYMSVGKPEDAQILDADEGSLLENNVLEETLEEAYESYEEEMESAYDSDDRLTPSTRLSESTVDMDEINDLEGLLNTDKKINSAWYVEYEEVLLAVSIIHPPE